MMAKNKDLSKFLKRITKLFKRWCLFGDYCDAFLPPVLLSWFCDLSADLAQFVQAVSQYVMFGKLPEVDNGKENEEKER